MVCHNESVKTRKKGFTMNKVEAAKMLLKEIEAAIENLIDSSILRKH